MPVALVSVAVARARFGGESAIGQTLPPPAGTEHELTIVGTFELHDERARTLDDFGYRKEHVFRGLMAQILEYSGVYPRDFDWVREANRPLRLGPSGAGSGRLQARESVFFAGGELRECDASSDR